MILNIVMVVNVGTFIVIRILNIFGVNFKGNVFLKVCR